MNINFNNIDMKTWSRAETYKYFTETVSTVIYSINVTIDITILRNALKIKGLKFFPTYLYLITKVMGKHHEFLMAIHDNTLGYFDYRTPFYPVFHEDDKTITFIWTEYNNDFDIFYKNYTSDIKQYGKVHGTMLPKGAPPANNYIISCVPWFYFNSISMQLQNAKNYYAPIFESGKFNKTNTSTTMPLSITVNHAAIDGYHIKLFLDDLQWEVNHPEKWIKNVK